MCETAYFGRGDGAGAATIAVTDAVGTALAHDITEIRRGEFKGPAFRKGHVVRAEDIHHLQRLGKERLFVLKISGHEMHEDDAVHVLAQALMGAGTKTAGAPREGKINILAEWDGMLKVNREALLNFNLAGDVMCATLHDHTLVREGQVIAGTRAIPLVIRQDIVEMAAQIAREAGGVLSVKKLRKPRAGIVITGNEVYHGRIKDAFAPIITEKIHAFGGEVVGTHYAPDNAEIITRRLNLLLEAGADLLITTGGMSVDPDDVTRFAIRNLGPEEVTYGSAVLPGAMFLIGYLHRRTTIHPAGNGYSGVADAVPVIGIPACGMYARNTVFDIVLPRVLAGERIGRRELAELGHGGLCMKCEPCRFPACPFGK